MKRRLNSREKKEYELSENFILGTAKLVILRGRYNFVPGPDVYTMDSHIAEWFHEGYHPVSHHIGDVYYSVIMEAGV